MELLLAALWYMLPAGAGNMAPIFANKIPGYNRWNTPLDGERKLRGIRILGPHKTVRGLLAGVLAGLIVGGLQGFLINDSIFGLPAGLYNGVTPILLGGLLGFGALLGDAVESFFKRQIGVKSGDSWFPYDQIDYVIGASLCGALIAVLSVEQYVLILFVWFCLHLISSYIGYLLRLKSKPI